MSATAPAQAPGAVRSWNFQVFLDQTLIGYQNFRLTPTPDGQELTNEAHFRVKVLFIEAYHYDLHATELWQGDCLRRLDAHTDDDGTLLDVHAHSDGDALQVQAAHGSYTLQGCTMSFAYWNPAMLRQSHLINPEDGRDVAVTISRLDDEDITVHGASVHAQHYHLHAAQLEIDLWYSASGQWLALQSPSKGGRRLRYVLN